MDKEEETYSDTPSEILHHATVGDVINLDTVSQDSVPLDDSVSVEGLNVEKDSTEEETGVGKSEDADQGSKMESDNDEEAKIGSPKPFDARLFGDIEESDPIPKTDFPIQAPVSGPSSLETDETTGEVFYDKSERSESLAIEAMRSRQTSVDGFESQPIGSPAAHFKFSGSDNPSGDTSQGQSLVGVDTVSAAGAQPNISSFFEGQVPVETVGDVEATNFFDSFTSWGDGFVRSESTESSKAEDIDVTIDHPSNAPEIGSQTPNQESTKGTNKVSQESAKEVSQELTKQTLFELSRRTSGQDTHGAHSDDQPADSGNHSPDHGVTSPHVCRVEDNTEGEPFKVAFTKTQGAPETDAKGPTESPKSLTKLPSPEAVKPLPKPQLFAPMSPSQEGQDAFAAAISMSHSDRRHDAWLPTSTTQKVLANRMLALQGTEFVDRAQLTMPGIVLEEPQGDPVKELVYRYMGESEASKRVALTVDHVMRDEAGLKKLLDAGCLRAALDLTGLLLTSAGQGKGQTGMPSKHTPQSLQIWLTRFALLVKLHQFSMAEVELEAFGNLDRPDLFFEYYPDLYPGRKGTMVAFSFHVLHAELPIYVGKYQDALDRLYLILDVTTQILFNLESGLGEYGAEIELTDENQKASVDLWKSREVRVLYSIGNCLLLMKDFNQAVSVYETLLKKDASNASGLLSGIGRIFLQLGDMKAAQRAFTRVEESYHSNNNVKSQATLLMNQAFLHMAQNQYAEARKSLDALLEVDPGNFTAVNNQCVCLLYMGKLKDALALLEGLVHSDPTKYLEESLLFNLCTLYELESSRSGTKKQSLLSLVNKHKGDGFNIGCLKML